jgi:hypothetical protein
MDQGVHIDWEPVESLAQKAVKEGWIAEIALTAATVAMLGWMVFSLHKAVLNAQVMGSALL